MHCRKSKPTGPFDTCLVVDGHLKESCTNCHYGGTGARYSFRDGEFALICFFACDLTNMERLDYENALAQAEANENEAPEIEGMAPANYTGGSLKDKGVDGIDTLIAGGTGGAGTAAATPGIARGGGEGKPRRIAPTQVARATGQPLVGLFGSTTEGRVNFAKGLSAEQRAEEKARLEKALEAIATADKGKQRKRRTLRKRTTSFIKKQEDDEGDSESLGDDTTADESDSGSLIDDATIEKGDSESLGDGSEKIEDGSSLTTTDDTQMEGGKSEPSGNEPK